jgi:hypothetical protein
MNNRNRSDLRSVSALVRGALLCYECPYCGTSMSATVDAHYAAFKCALPSCAVSPTTRMSISTLATLVPELQRTHGFGFIHVPPPSITNKQIAAKFAEWRNLCQRIALYFVMPWLFFSLVSAAWTRARALVKQAQTLLSRTAASSSRLASVRTRIPPSHSSP